METIDTTVWDVTQNVQPSDAGPRTMHGLPVQGCGLNLRFDQYDERGHHLPHTNGKVWCPGSNARVGWSVGTCDHALVGVENSHGGHTHTDRGEQIMWCRGHAATDAGRITWAGSEPRTSDDQRADQQAAYEYEARQRTNDSLVEFADAQAGYRRG